MCQWGGHAVPKATTAPRHSNVHASGVVIETAMTSRSVRIFFCWVLVMMVGIKGSGQLLRNFNG